MGKTNCVYDGHESRGGCAGCTATGCAAPVSWLRLTVILSAWSMLVILGMGAVNHLFPERTTYASVAQGAEIEAIQPRTSRRDPRIADVEDGDWLSRPAFAGAVVSTRHLAARRP